jgi:hypothetical protein
VYDSLRAFAAVAVAAFAGGCGGTSSGSESPPPAPTVSLSAAPTTVVPGGSASLNWSSANAASCEASGAWSGQKAVSGSASTGPLTASSTYTLRCTGTGGATSASATVTVSASGQPPTVTLSATPGSTTTGGRVSLSWTSTDATSCTASGGWTGSKPTTGTEQSNSLSNTTQFILDCTGAGGTARDSVIVDVTPVASGAVFPLRVSPNKRFLADVDGQPFLVNGDSPWSLMVALDDADVIRYLDDRQSRGFNTILVNLIEHRFAASPPRNVYGVAPFATPEDIRTPDDAYFERCASIVQLALDRKLLVMLTPAYLGYNGGNEGWWAALSSRTTAEVEAYGAYLGGKFRSLPNIVWVMGGDYWDPQVLSRTQALVAGLKGTGRADWLFTYHTGGSSSSAEAVGSEDWLDLTASYSNEAAGPAAQLLLEYDRLPTRPFFLIESRYEQEPSPPVGRLALRSQAYWSVLMGGVGAMFGNNPIWNFENNALFPYSGTWQTNLGSNGAQDRTRFVDFFQAYDWSSLVPDRSGTLLTGGQGSGSATAYAAKSTDSSLAMVYTPAQKQLTIDMSRLTGPDVEARWFRPEDATYTPIGTLANSGTRDFTPPGAGDWVLVLSKTP